MKFLVNELRHRMMLQQRMLLKDEQGGFSEKWENLSGLWVKLKPLVSWSRGNPLEVWRQKHGAEDALTRLYKATVRLHHPVRVGMRLQGKDLCLAVLEEPFREGGYQFFNVRAVPKRDGDAR